MKTKTVTRNLNFNQSQRKPTSRYRVKFGDAGAFMVLRVRCVNGSEVQIFEAPASKLPPTKESIHFLAQKSADSEDSFIISWCDNAEGYMVRKF